MASITDADKPTYVALLGLEGARAYADELRTEALEALTRFGDRASDAALMSAFAQATGSHPVLAC